MTLPGLPRGSEWRKWDLQIHAPGGTLYDGYETEDASDALDRFCDEIEKSDVAVFGITDYFSFNGFERFRDRFSTKYPNSTKCYFFNLELRLNESVNKELEEVNVHLVFNPASLTSVSKFLGRLSVVKSGKDGLQMSCADLEGKDFESAVVTREAITKAFVETFGPKAVRQDHFLVVTAANNDGIRAQRGVKRKEGISDEIDKFSDAFFGSAEAKNPQYFLKTDRYEDDQLAAKKPVISSSDAHSFEDMANSLGKRFVIEEIDKDGKRFDKVVSDVTWIKADPTYEGLKQMLYEPVSGERVFIGPVKPDEKDGYKVISRMIFGHSQNFPAEVVFNSNLCSIIGSRSSGKSALLAYIAHAIDPGLAKRLMKGPGQGEKYHWDKVEIDHSVEWANGKTNAESPGRVVYIPQNHLFDKSRNPREITEKIQPVLFRVLPNFEARHRQAEIEVEERNTTIAQLVDEWFVSAEAIKAIDLESKELGDRAAIEQQKNETEARIKTLRETYSLNESDLEAYQRVSADIARIKNRNVEIDGELTPLVNVRPTKDYFASAKITLAPAPAALPINLQELINRTLERSEAEIAQIASREVLEYKYASNSEKNENSTTLTKIQDENKELLDKYQKNAELQQLVKASTNYVRLIKRLNELKERKTAKELEQAAREASIAAAMASRTAIIDGLKRSLDGADQSALKEIRFGIEYGFADQHVETLENHLNVRARTQFVENNSVKIDRLQASPIEFLHAVHNGTQKLIANVEKREVVRYALQMTQTVLFSADMEGDKIGGFSEPTMTPGKGALFALRLILAESDDAWPLLIDQPEDDLDSRSIYDEVVPFLREKKKERQIIMVSHNANLVIGSDSEQMIVANRSGSDRLNSDGKHFNYLSGSLEFSRPFDPACRDTLASQGTCEHACAILDGGKVAFESRKNKYQIR